MPRIKKLTDYSYSPTNPASEDAIRLQIDDAIQEVYDASAKPDDTVNLVGDQTIAGIKTFTSSPVVPAPTNPTQATNKSYVDGVAISATVPLNSVTDEYLSDVDGNIKQRVQTLEISKKPSFLEQFITGFYGRGMLAAETQNITTETSIIIPRLAGYGGVEIADTTQFKNGAVISIKYDDGTYGTHFITNVVNSTTLAISPTLLKDTTTNTKIEKAWYNCAHAGKFYMRNLAQRLADATELVEGYGENIFYANFDGLSTDDFGTVVGIATIGYLEPINKGTNYKDIIERGVGKTAFVETASIGGGIKLPSFYAKHGEKLVMELFAMNRASINNTKISIKSEIGEVASFIISGPNSQIMKPYHLEFYAPYDSNLLYVEITNQTALSNTVFIDEIKVMRNKEINNYLLPRKGKILAFGDSWVAGDLGNTPEREPLTTHLTTLLPDATIINKGVGGNKVQDLLARFDTDVKPFNPDVVIIHTGVNDSYNPASVTFDPTAMNYYVGKIKELVQKCLDINAKPVVVGIPALAEEDGSFTNFELNDRSRLYNKKLYREYFNDNHGNPTVKLLSTNKYGKLENNGVYLSGNNYKDVKITIGLTEVKLKKVQISAYAFDASTAANITLKVYNSDRTVLLATSNTLAIEAGMPLQKLEFIIPITTLVASTSYTLAFEGSNLWSVQEGGNGATKNYGIFTITNTLIGNTIPPTFTSNKWIGIVLVPVVGVANIFVNNTPTRYTFSPTLTTVDQDTSINILDDLNKVVLSFNSKVGYEFDYEE